MEKENLVYTILGILGILVIVNLFISFNIMNGGIKDITGSVVEENLDSEIKDNSAEVIKDLNKKISKLEEENSALAGENDKLRNEINDLKGQLEEILEEKEVKKEVCSITCDKDEICIPINKADGSVLWQCVDDPKHVLGAS